MKNVLSSKLVQTPLKSVVSRHEEKIGLKFAPDKRFYQKVSINAKRFGQLLRGEKTLTVIEAKSLAGFFEVPLTELF